MAHLLSDKAQSRCPPACPCNASVIDADIWCLVEPIPGRAATIVSVCRRWRAVALADPALWTIISDRQDRRPLTIAGQCRAAIELRLLATPSQAVRELMESHGHRIRAIRWGKANVRPSELGILATPGCRLEKLVLGMSPHLPTIGASMITPILHTQTAYLRWLTLRDCNALPETPLPNLTGLHLDGYPGPGASSALHSLLACAHKLTDLVLSNVDLVDDAAISYTHVPVQLPHLSRLVFAGCISPESAAAFLARVDLPLSTSIRVHTEPHTPLFAGLARTPAFRDATDAYVSAERSDTILTGPNAAVCFVGQDALHVSASTSLRKRVSSVNTANENLGEFGSNLGLHDRQSDRRPEGATVTVLMTRFMTVSIVLAKLARWAEAQTTHVVIGYLPTYKGDRAYTREFESAFASLEIVDHMEEPRPALPDICLKTGHCLWPAWLE
ncbi:hypothetical protein FOMPIDRAFT_111959 [Fomitopsis schrenkii]|uniref:F-box domain-containing protein n=1 Tax=Fomitopsis schrenkii TaxID=2126942 RepID=S8EDK6_FOMSC|nr:hypothetical protein FOMPIDRAFT_111959 [Fomitopsis schrenkii]